MSGARLRELRVIGFKSFAERTIVEFESGISAIVGPNGSGKSNLADALRWALGEQGRSLRTRRAEDVIFAGSSTRRAIGMADVTLRVDNSDGLLPVDYAEVELGRRLFRSGENEYLLNRQRIRLRDLADLLDAANLADNAFLFIGQGMVDQALALRPEERRPLFEEAAGIRRHERRRRRAEAELVESEANLDRLRDILAELRPQARRLAAQAEQQEARATAAADLAQGLVAAARNRMVAGSRAVRERAASLEAARGDAATLLAALRDAEEAVGTLTAAMAQRADAERAVRHELDAARAQTVEGRMAEARLSFQLASLERDREARVAERRSLVEGATLARRGLVVPLPAVEPALREAAQEAAAAEVEAVRALDALRDAGMADGGSRAVERERQVRTAERERLLRRAEEAETARSATEERRRAAESRARSAGAAGDAAWSAGQAAADRERSAQAAVAAAREAAQESALERSSCTRQQAALESRGEAVQAELKALEEALARSTDGRLARGARARGGRRVADGLEVDPQLRLCVEAVLGEILTGFLVPAAAIPALLDSGSGTLVPTDTERPAGVSGRRQSAAESSRTQRAAETTEAASSVGGGALADAVRLDPQGAITRLLRRALWVPTLEMALALYPRLPEGWCVATPEGVVVSDQGTVRAGIAASLLDREARRDGLARAQESLEEEIRGAVRATEQASEADDAAQVELARALADLDAATRDRRVADEASAAAERILETHMRDAEWEAAGRDRLEREVRLLTDALDEAERLAGPAPEAVAGKEAGREDAARAAEAWLRERITALAERRATLARELAASEGEAESAREQRRRTEIQLALGESRMAELDAELLRLVAACSDAAAQQAGGSSQLRETMAREDQLAAELERIEGAARSEREALASAERRQLSARDRLRESEDAVRSAEVAHVEARFAREGAREQLLGELVAVPSESIEALAEPTASATAPGDLDDPGAALEAALDAAIERWIEGPGEESGTEDHPAELPAPSAARLAALRRRYHELGASNPFAASEYAELRDRLVALEAQHADLDAAILSTRQLIVALSARISVQFRETFAALEGAFARRFGQLFDGGEAELSLTDPENLSTTGVEITARPPGKKRQPLAMLSGGERALTAVALLMAMLEVRPVPFCVLDEVDAALDEANIGRFSAALRSLAETIQFIVITHNRGTIEAADALYGVTADDDAISRVVSLRLADLSEPQARSPVTSGA